MLPVAIHSQEAESTAVDWRTSVKDLRYSVYTLPERIEQLCIKLMQQLGLLYGTIDMIVIPNPGNG